VIHFKELDDYEMAERNLSRVTEEFPSSPKRPLQRINAESWPWSRHP